MTAVVDENQRLVGIFTDGDLRRVLAQQINIHETPISEFMTTNCKVASPSMLAVELLEMMQTHKINGLMITDQAQNLVGAINMHDLLRAGVV
jgi:arabinose-5-phosphate isomerase